MPVIKKKKYPKYILEQAQNLGPCLKPAMEIWWLTGKKLNVGTIEKITPGESVEVLRADGSTAKLNPEETIIMGPSMPESKQK